MAYEVVIGLEAHAQLLTVSKMFCGCRTAFGAAPNTQTCPVCLGMPGVLPVINRKAVEFAIQTGLALNCRIAPMNRFARKNYFYPDLPKGYQISQYELPICQDGWMEIGENGTAKRIRIRRAHLEEDAGKNLHTGIAGASHVDLNRAGTPLLEIVTEPDLRSPDEAAPMRSKEEAHDYRYFPDPDLVPLRITTEMVEEARKALPELPEAIYKRFMEEYGLPEYDADVLTSAKDLAKFFEDTVKAQAEATVFSGKDLGKETSNWVMVELLGLLHKGKPKPGGGAEPWTIEQDPYEQSPVTPQRLAELLVMKRKGEISGPIAKSVLEEMYNTGKSAAEIIKAKGLMQVSDEGTLEEIIDEVMAQNPQQLTQYRSGKEQVFGFFVGQVMKASGGKANPAKVNELLKRKLAG